MIFITTGTQKPFDRLIAALDEIAPKLKNEKIVAQAELENYYPVNFEVSPFMDPSEFEKNFDKADLVVSHAGMGTILSALEKEKPLIIMPRLLKYKEHRNEHQLATANKFKSLGYVRVADDESELIKMLLGMSKIYFKPTHKIGKLASTRLVRSIQNFIEE